MKYKHLGHRISVLRKERNMTQEELAFKSNLNRLIITKIENMQRTTSIEEASSIAKAIGIGLDSLLDYEKENEDNDKSFVKAFKAKKKLTLEQEKEIKKFELLFDALCIQEQIYKGE